MELDTGRLRPADWLLGFSSVLLLLDLFLLPWFGLTPTFAYTATSLGQQTQVNGWEAMLVIGPLVLLAGLFGLGGVFAQAVSRGPALPVTAAAIAEGFGLISLFGVLGRVVFAPPAVLVPGSGLNAVQSLVGGYLGLALTAVLLAASWWTLREDGIAAFDGPQKIEVLRLAQR